jgi:monovalent cation:H+ antiporter, CPA1 family
VNTLIVLFCIATAVAIAAQRLRAPYTVALLIVGLVLGAFHLVGPPHLTKGLLFGVFLPGLLFEAAFHIEASVFRRLWIAIAALAIPGVIVAMVITSLILVAALRGFGLVPDLAWGTAFIFSALIAATDPVAVTALFRELSAPRDLIVLIEGESLFNDGTAIVFLSLVLAYVGGTPGTGAGLVVDFVRIAGGGGMIGFVVGVAATHAIRRVNEPVIEIALTMIGAYGSFALAEELHLSGVIATVVAGMICGNQLRGAARPAQGGSATSALESFWEYIAFALNSVVFLLIGFEVSIGSLLTSWKEILAAYVAVLVARALIVFGGQLIASPFSRQIGPRPNAWSVVLVWGGLRGALSMVLALALGAHLEHRALIVTMTTGVVLLTLLVQGLTTAPLLRRLGLAAVDSPEK